MNDRIHAYLDGELRREDLSAEELARAVELEGAIAAVASSLRQAPVPDLRARVMTRVVEASTPWWRRALRWAWAPRPIQLRPAYALLGAAVVALVPLAGPRQETPGLASGEAGAPAAHADVPTIYVQFRLNAPEASSVELVGSFTRWEPDFALQEVSPGVWSATVPLRAGVHDYAFLVDGERWVADPHAPQVDDSFGGTNSRIALAPLEARV